MNPAPIAMRVIHRTFFSLQCAYVRCSAIRKQLLSNFGKKLLPSGPGQISRIVGSARRQLLLYLARSKVSSVQRLRYCGCDRFLHLLHRDIGTVYDFLVFFKLWLALFVKEKLLILWVSKPLLQEG